MKLRLVFGINALIQIGWGLLLVLRSDSLIHSEILSKEFMALLQLYILSIILIGSVSLLIFKHFTYQVVIKYIALIFFGFHLIMAINLYSFYEQTILTKPYAFIIHFFMSMLFGFYYFKEKHLFNINN